MGTTSRKEREKWGTLTLQLMSFGSAEDVGRPLGSHPSRYLRRVETRNVEAC